MNRMAAVVALTLLLGAAQESATDALKKGRWDAGQLYLEKGEASRAALVEAAKSSDGDASFYARAALAELDAARDGEAAPLPRTTALGGRAGDVASKLFASADLEATGTGLPQRAASLPAGLSFAGAVDRLSKDLDVEFRDDPPASWRAEAPFLAVPRFASGRVRARLDAVIRFTSLEPGSPPDKSILLEGRLEVFGGFREPILFATKRVIEARDDRGIDLRQEEDPSSEVGHIEKTRRGEGLFQVDLLPPGEGATRVALLRLAADFHFEKTRGEVTFDVSAGTNGVTKKAGEVTAILDRCYWEEGRFRPVIKFLGDGLGSRIELEDARLLDGDGRAWEPQGHGGGGRSKKLDYDLCFTRPAGAGPPIRLVWSMITETRVRSVHFEFRDVPLR